jgi:uncharacterized Zn finger protein (UPF0148 family)
MRIFDITGFEQKNYKDKKGNTLLVIAGTKHGYICGNCGFLFHGQHKCLVDGEHFCRECGITLGYIKKKNIEKSYNELKEEKIQKMMEEHRITREQAEILYKSEYRYEKSWSEEEREELKKMFEEGKSTGEIAEKLKRTKAAIYTKKNLILKGGK